MEEDAPRLMSMVESALDEESEGPSLREFLLEAFECPGPSQSYFAYDADKEPLFGIVVAQDEGAERLDDFI
jgi:hypothetical protein